jgi:aryl-alcohol dehydrogenase-like predicted oxidoreductase
MSLRRLKIERIDLWQLHRIDPKVPSDEQFGVIADMRKEGLIRHAGLSNSRVEDIEAAQKFFPVVSVQKPLQSRRSRQRGRARMERQQRPRLHSMAPARGRRAGEAQFGS